MEVEQEARACNHGAPGERELAWGKRREGILITRVERNRAEMSHGLSVTSSDASFYSLR